MEQKQPKIRVLDIGSGEHPIGEKHFPDAEFTTLDADNQHEPDIVHDITEPFPEELHEQFDVVYASHVMEHIPYRKIHDTFKNLNTLVKEGGELWVIVPSLEWAASEIYKEDHMSPVILGVLYGGQRNEHDFHRTGYTLIYLRYLFRQHGFVERRAFVSEFTISTTKGEYQAGQNIVIGVKYTPNGAGP